MFNKYKRFNVKLLGLHIFLSATMLFGIILTGDIDTYIEDMFFVIIQVWALSLIPNLIYLYLNRKEQGNVSGFLGIAVILLFPYIVIAIVMGFTYI